MSQDSTALSGTEAAAVRQIVADLEAYIAGCAEDIRTLEQGGQVECTIESLDIDRTLKMRAVTALRYILDSNDQ